VIAPDVGGGFGSKIYIYPEEIVCLWASKRTGVPVKWNSDRTEAFLTDAHGRDHVSTVKMAFDADNKITGFKVDTIANLGAYMSLFSSSVPTYLYATLLSGQYNIPNIHANVRTVYTNTVPGGRLSRRRTPGSHLSGGADHGNGGARTRNLASGVAQDQLHPRVPAPDAGDHVLRRGRFRSVA
jgi:CO/xanthine dehydrogenase Mo-binding subunit